MVARKHLNVTFTSIACLVVINITTVHTSLMINNRGVHQIAYLRGGADKSLAQPKSRCRRTESIVSLERGVCSCAELQVFSCYSD